MFSERPVNFERPTMLHLGKEIGVVKFRMLFIILQKNEGIEIF